MGVPSSSLIFLAYSYLLFAANTTNSTNSTYREDGVQTPENEAYHKELVNKINKKKSSWTAIYNRFADTKKEVHSSDLSLFSAQTVNRFLNTRPRHLHETEEHFRSLVELNFTLPREYDVRKAWSQCWTVHQIFNQGPCGSCWAIASSSVMSDRICIASNGTQQKLISAEDLITCCEFCGGCKGSIWTLSPFSHWKINGVVTGGPYGSHSGCRPYSFEPHCGSPCSVPKYSKTPTPACQKTCQDLHSKQYDNDISKGKSAYWLRAWVLGPHVDEVRRLLENLTEEYIGKADSDNFYTTLIMREIYLNGPVLACSAIFEEFQHYGNGIYRHLEGDDEMYGHCMKLLGWGREGNNRYWLYANTWGRDWGENGYFRVQMSDLPEEVVAGLPDI